VDVLSAGAFLSSIPKTLWTKCVTQRKWHLLFITAPPTNFVNKLHYLRVGNYYSLITINYDI